MRSMVCVPPQCTRDALLRVAFVFAFCVAPFAQAGHAAPAEVSPKAVESAVRHAPAPSVRQMLETATNVADDASRSNLRRLLDSATRARAPQPAATVSQIANTSSGDEIFPDGFDRTCRALGNKSCGINSDCCSMTCSAGTCINASGTIGCHADLDTCAAASDCCSGQCDLAASGGSCVPLSNFVATTCAVEGEPCSAGNDCCSLVCASVPGGGMACQSPPPSGGCHLVHELCTADATCCGGTEGKVICSIIAGTNPAEGLCSNPAGCNPDGDLCGGGARTDCCGSPGSSGICGAGLGAVNRCFSGSATCTSAGQVCAYSADCCNAVPCVPDAGGILRCAATSCMPSTAACTTNADCCSGLQCSIAPGALGGTCTL